MNSFYEHHQDSIRFHYRCFDRILLNGLIQPFRQPEKSDRVLRHLPAAISGEPRHAARDRRSVSAMAEVMVSEARPSPTRSSRC
jgi:hypothetical protein